MVDVDRVKVEGRNSKMEFQKANNINKLCLALFFLAKTIEHNKSLCQARYMNCGVDLLSCVRSKVSSKIHLRIRANALRWSSVMRIASLSSFYTIWFFKLRAQAHFNNLLTANVVSNDARATAEQPRVRSKLEIEWNCWGIWQIYNFKWQKVYVVLRSSTYQNLLSSRPRRNFQSEKLPKKTRWTESDTV